MNPIDDELMLNELGDVEQLDILLPGILEHSDFTVLGSLKHRVREQLDALEEKEGRLTAELALSIIKRADVLVAAMDAYDPLPYWLQNLLRGYVIGNYKLAGGQFRNPDWAKDRDVVGVFNKLLEMGFNKKGIIYQKLAEHLNVVGWNGGSDNHATAGAETVRQHIMRMTDKIVS